MVQRQGVGTHLSFSSTATKGGGRGRGRRVWRST
jgi:hypothetical protein